MDQLVFIRLLARKDKNQVADIHPTMIAADTGLPLEEVRAALTRLESADPESRSPIMGGRRISRLEEHRNWGWVIVNGKKYDDLIRALQLRDQSRQRQRKWAEKHQPNADLTLPNADLTQKTPLLAVNCETLTASSTATTLFGKPNAVPCEICTGGLTELNTQAGTNYRLTSKAALKAAHARHLEHGPESLVTVIRHKCREWGGDPKMAKYLRPATLFRASNFAAYLDDAIAGNGKQAHAYASPLDGTRWKPHLTVNIDEDVK